MLETSCHPTELAASAGYAALFVMGMTMSVGHCVGMCGPIQMTFATEQAARGGVKTSMALYHAGRIFSYMLIGLALGTVGASTGLLAGGGRAQALATTAAGLVMVFFVVLGFPNAAHGTPWSTWAARSVARYLRTSSPSGRFALGVANGFLPCGPVWAAALSAAALAHPVTGMLLMGAYGLGTTPVLATVGVSAAKWSPKFRQVSYKVGGVLVFLLGLQLTLRGLANLQLIGHGSMGPLVFW